MTDNTCNRNSIRQPIESHTTAAWANIEKTKRVSNVQMPDVGMIENAKEYVDENEK